MNIFLIKFLCPSRETLGNPLANGMSIEQQPQYQYGQEDQENDTQWNNENKIRIIYGVRFEVKMNSNIIYTTVYTNTMKLSRNDFAYMEYVVSIHSSNSF